MAFNFKAGIILKQYRNSILKEVFRKSIHICSAFVPFFLSYNKYPVIACLIVALIFYCISEQLRLKGVEIPLIARITQVASRKRDENKFVLGPVTLVIGIILSSLVWRDDCARIGIYSLAFGDGCASLCGKLYGRIHIPFTNGKTAEGSLACFCAVFISSFTVCHNTFASILLSFVAMITEVLPLTDFDNIILPILIGGIAQYIL